MKVETAEKCVVINQHFIVLSKRDADDLIAQLRAAAETVWPESVPCHGEPVRCAECDGYGHEYPDGGVICIDCNGSGENWRYEGGVVAKWYAGPLITETEKSDDTE